MFTPVPSPTTNSYDEVPYESHPYPQTHPSRLFTIATLFGLSPPPVENARVLELGCAAGGNIIPMAEAFPNATFVGIDLSARQVADGQKTIADAGLTNVTLRHANILDLEPDSGPLDYILCHGVFSWVPDTVRDKIFSLAAGHLAPPALHMGGTTRTPAGTCGA